ncbi:GNAT family N-acetyltransferase [Bacillus cereus group sp. BfR-BA-01380]|uniref:GNAT family N-acetyltransferase n=1 Tax=Bacillus cereus group sp. BfR-BA-01380 TaxID=2920324 RepID=UPI001F59AEF6|nr:GNAT family N-acetyltransferase [Bacillus cereus group sp. BfR-BA-01380]
MESQNELQIYKFCKEDIPKLIALSASIGWDYDENEINTIMSVGTIYGHKTNQGEIISSAALIPYGNNLASIGMVIVNENYRGYGLGKKLTQACINAVSNKITIMLVATKEGYPLYEKIGFQSVTCIHKLLNDNNHSFYPIEKNHDYDILPLTDSHFTDVCELDRRAVGADRKLFLKSRMKQAKQGVVVRAKTGDVIGYGLSIQGPIHLVLGPIVARNHDVATHIIHHLATGYKGKLRIDVPDGQSSFVTYLEQCGFKKVNQPPVMIKNAITLPRRNHTLYSLASQAFG